MSEVVSRIIPAKIWTPAVGSMTIPEGAKGVLILAGGSITIEDGLGESIALSSSVTVVYPLVPSAVTAASSAYILS